MDRQLLQSVIRHSLILAGFAVTTALALALVHQGTSEAIAQQRRTAERQALSEVMPPSVHDNDLLEDTLTLDPAGARFDNLALLGLTGPATARIARLDGAVSGVVLPAQIHDGYGGDIDIIVGILRDGTISGVRVLSHRETPGLGDKIELRVSDWILGFNGKSLGNPPESEWGVRNDGGAFDQFTGATITPRAVVRGVRKTLRFFAVNRDTLLQ